MSLTELFTSIADAIRLKSGSNELIKATEFPQKIIDMPIGGDPYEIIHQIQNHTITEYSSLETKAFQQSQFYDCNQLKKVNTPNVTAIPTSCFFNCIALEEFDFTNITSIASSTFRNCQSLREVIIKNDPIYTGFNSAMDFGTCTSLKRFIAPNITWQLSSSCFSGDKALELADLGNAARFYTQLFNNCSKIKAIILRRKTIIPMSNINALANTPFRDGLGGIFYIPNDLIEEYKIATNYSVLESAEFLPIEGSAYEDLNWYEEEA